MQRIDTLHDVFEGAWETTPDTGVQEEELCVTCRGGGWLRWDVDVDDQRFGKPLRCDCQTGAQREKRMNMSELGTYRTYTFESFDPDVKGIQVAAKIAQDFANEPTGWLFMSGAYGCGKTHLAAAIANTAAQQGYDVLFRPLGELLDELRSGYENGSYMRRLERCKRAQVLVIDDYGTQIDTAWSKDKLFQILNSRYVTQAATVVTSNLSIDRIYEHDGRLGSRLSDRMLVRHLTIKAADYRRFAGKRAAS